MVVILLSFVFAGLIYKKVDPHQSELFFSIFALLPFAAITLLLRLRNDAAKLAKNSNLLTVTEQRRFSKTAKQKMRIYFSIGFLNFIAGLACIFVALLKLSSDTFAFLLTFSVCLSALTILVSFIDDGSYSAIIQLLERRNTNKERKKELLKGFTNSTPSAQN